MPSACHVETADSAQPHQSGDAGFAGLDRGHLEQLATSELEGVVEGPRLLSNGGPWVTFVARDAWDGTRTLLSIRRRERLDDRATEDVLRAARDGRDLAHSALLPPRRAGRTGDLLWVAAREYRGRLLDHWYPQGQSSSSSRVVELVGLVTDPLEAIHGAGLVHGGLTTSSFHRDVAGTIRICNLGVDLSIARAELAAGHGSEIVGLASPEVRQGREPVAASDQYSLAALAVRLLTGRYPERDGGLPEQVPPELRPILGRALDSDPEARFSNMRAFYEALLWGFDVTDERVDGTFVPEPYVPSAFRSRRSADERMAAFSTPFPDVTLEEALEDATGADAWDEERWELDTPPRRRSSGRRELLAALVLVVLSGSVALFYGDVPYTLPLRTSDTEASEEGGLQERDASLMGSESAESAESAESGSDSELSAGGEDAAGTGTPPAAAEPLGEEPTAPPAVPTSRTPDATAPTGSGGDPTPEPAAAEPAPAVPAATAPTGDAAEPVPEPVATEPAPRTSSPTSAPAWEAPPAPGTLSMQSYPWGEVYLDGQYLGTTPLLDVRVPAGVYTLRIVRAGYEAHVRELVVQPGQALRLTGIVLRGGGR